MSGITPLLDTLLHQVLGKRVDTASPRELTEPVRPVAPGGGPRALHSDSRLEGERPPVAPLRGTLTPGQREPGGAPRGDASAPPASTQTHFSPSARTIADVLHRFPAPPSVLSAPAPLMAEGESTSTTTLMQRLQASVRESGLFYESHLARWYRGEISRQQLERQPQMLNTPRATPAPPQGTTAPAAPLAPLTPGLPQGGVPLAGTPAAQAASHQSQAAHYVATEALYAPGARGEAQAGPAVPGRESAASDVRAEARETALREGSVPAARAAGSDPVHDSLQGVVRHQLELLVTPALRWEGDVWSGIFMALLVHLPAAAQRHGEGEGQEEAAQQETWHSEIRLSVPRLGDVHVALWLQGQGLPGQEAQSSGGVRLQLQSDDQATLEALQAGVPELELRLRETGLPRVLIDVRARSTEGDEEGRENAGIET